MTLRFVLVAVDRAESSTTAGELVAKPALLGRFFIFKRGSIPAIGGCRQAFGCIKAFKKRAC
jgi:hypothetical protein